MSHLDVVTPNMRSVIDRSNRIKLKNNKQLIILNDELSSSSFLFHNCSFDFFLSTQAPVGARQEI
jgi:hypothetical protein